MKILLASVEPDLTDTLRFILIHAGYVVEEKRKLKEAVSTWFENPSDMAIVVGTNTEEVRSDVKSLRMVSEIPLLSLVEDARESETVSLLQAGADLILPLPVGPQLLTHYCQSLLRRANRIPEHTLPVLDLERIRLDPSSRTVKVENREPVRLTQLEFRLLYVLMTQRGHVIPSEVIVDRVWGYSGTGNKELVRGLVSRLRSKIEVDPSAHKLIHTVPGVGYIFDIET
jgi:DNA-binding response OmpR family regulator